ncbi:ABC transporter permease [Natronosalvus halobius]|uniref:ABC transporter permease n=1 Tax=Natronosalvus halobius TaxID=2953746 RepID=UPI00209DDDE9|nr:ABC transporter permease [Natronosalvus halobius]USZ73664.1 ABC transporter permease [Natronosalvus halobius]
MSIDNTPDTPESSSPAITANRRTKILRRILKNKLAIVGLIIVFGLVFVAVFAPIIAPHDPTKQQYDSIEEPPSIEHPFGTDNLGRDVFSRTLYGSQYALFLGVVVVGLQMVIGVSLGLIAGYYGGVTESVIMRIVDIALSMPGVVLALAIAGMLGGGLWPLIIALTLVGWRGFARLVRGDVKSVMEEEYIDAARASGASDFHIITRYVFPNASSSIIVYATLTLPTVVLWSAGLSFLGMGVQPPTPEWGALIADGRNRIDTAWWIATFPGFAIMLTVIGFNVVGDALRDALDPKQEQ